MALKGEDGQESEQRDLFIFHVLERWEFQKEVAPIVAILAGGISAIAAIAALVISLIALLK